MAKGESGSLALLALGRPRKPSRLGRAPGGPEAPGPLGEETAEDVEDDDGLQAAMADLAGAMTEGDTAAMAEAFRSALDIAR